MTRQHNFPYNLTRKARSHRCLWEMTSKLSALKGNSTGAKVQLVWARLLDLERSVLRKARTNKGWLTNMAMSTWGASLSSNLTDLLWGERKPIQLQKTSVSTGVPHGKTQQKVEEVMPLSQDSMPHLTPTSKRQFYSDKILYAIWWLPQNTGNKSGRKVWSVFLFML